MNPVLDIISPQVNFRDLDFSTFRQTFKDNLW